MSFAVGYLDVPILKALLSAGAEVLNPRVLANAANAGSVEIDGLLLNSNAPQDCAEALRIAAVGGHTEVLALLLKRSRVSTEAKTTALTWAAISDARSGVRLLLGDGAERSGLEAARVRARGFGVRAARGVCDTLQWVESGMPTVVGHPAFFV